MPIPVTYRLGAAQAVVGNSTASSQSSAFATGTNRVRVVATAACNIRFDQNPTALASDAQLVPAYPEYFTVSPGQKLAVFGAATVSITEVS
jgi:hypothetical protein